jgi:cytochrome c553
MNRILLPLLPVFALPLMAAAPNGHAIVLQGNGHGAIACTTCHGQNLQGNTALQAPALAGLPATTTLARLAHYAGPDGHNAMMRQVATALTPDERQAVANYLATLPKTE